MKTMPPMEIRWISGSTRDLPVRSTYESDLASEGIPGACYRCWNKENDLIYIGFSADPLTRFDSHSRKPWWPEVARVEVVWYPDQVDARIAESRVLENGPLKHCRQKPYARYCKDYEIKNPDWLARSRDRYQRHIATPMNDDVYDTEVDDLTARSLETLAEVRLRLVANLPASADLPAVAAIVDAYAAQLVAGEVDGH